MATATTASDFAGWLAYNELSNLLSCKNWLPLEDIAMASSKPFLKFTFSMLSM